MPTQATFNAAVKGVSRRNIAMTFGTEKLEWRGYPVLKSSEDTITRFDGITNVTDGRTDRQTDAQTLHDGIGRAWIALRGKKTVLATSRRCVNVVIVVQ